MNKKTFVFILVAVVIIGFILGFAVAKNGGKEEETTLPLIDDPVELTEETFLPEEEETETETETESETETTEESTTEKELKSETISTDYFNLYTPAEWYGEYTCKTKKPNNDGSFILEFTHNDSSKAGVDGKVFEIEVYPQAEGDNPEDIPGAELVGILDVNGEKFNVVSIHATDVRFTEDTADGYANIRDKADELIASLETKDGIEFEAK